jgi:hypothetical protein
MPNNQRIFYAVEQISFMPDGSTTPVAAHGVQSAGITTTFDLKQVFELGQLAIYDNVEDIPSIEVTMEKALDGYPLLYHLATANASTGTLVGRSNQKTTVGLSVFSDTMSSASGTPIAEVAMSGMVPSSLTYTFPVDGECTEAMTLVGNNKLWRDTGTIFTGAFLSNDDAPIGSGGTQHRYNVVFAVPTGTIPLDENQQLIALTTVLPTDIYGINSDGSNPIATARGNNAHVQGITISCDLGRDQILELGRKSPYARYVTFPVEVTTEITVIGTKWDGISATETGGQNGAPAGSNLKNQSIRVYTNDGTFISTGTRNKLRSVGYSGGNAGGGGGNVTVTYRYSTFNDLTVKHPADPTTALRGGGAV